MDVEQVFLTPREQDNIRQKLKKLHWIEERYGDEAKYQGFDQAELMGDMISTVCLLRLLFVAKFTD